MIALRTLRLALTAAAGLGTTSLVLPRNTRLIGTQINGTLTSAAGAAGAAKAYLGPSSTLNVIDSDVIRFAVVSLVVGAANLADSQTVFVPNYHWPVSDLLYLHAECIGAGNVSEFYAQIYVEQ